jgi:hypothetical protein
LRDVDTFSDGGEVSANDTPGRFLLRISVTGSVNRRATVRLEELGKMKKKKKKANYLIEN